MSGLNLCICLELALLVTQVITESERKRHFYDIIFPGTKWCGMGDVADSYDDLGTQVHTDSCCRDHDNCPDTIGSGQTKHNLTNNSFYTKLHCECDETFKQCLRSADEKEQSTAQAVGRLYFNVIDTKCFKEEYPIKKCKYYDDPRQSERIRKRQTVVNVFEMSQKIQNAISGSQRCMEYEYDKKAPKRWQWFDVPRFD